LPEFKHLRTVQTFLDLVCEFRVRRVEGQEQNLTETFPSTLSIQGEQT
jgi:hypothetical protein